MKYFYQHLLEDCTRNPNPLIRALAIRTMGCIRVPKIVEYLYQPLKISLKVNRIQLHSYKHFFQLITVD